jgi:hypothetical protein
MGSVETWRSQPLDGRDVAIKRSASEIAEDLAANVIIIDRLLNEAELTACIESAVTGTPEKNTQDVIDRLLAARQASAAMAAKFGRTVRPRELL